MVLIPEIEQWETLKGSVKYICFKFNLNVVLFYLSVLCILVSVLYVYLWWCTFIQENSKPCLAYSSNKTNIEILWHQRPRWIQRTISHFRVESSKYSLNKLFNTHPFHKNISISFVTYFLSNFVLKSGSEINIKTVRLKLFTVKYWHLHVCWMKYFWKDLKQ